MGRACTHCPGAFESSLGGLVPEAVGLWGATHLFGVEVRGVVLVLAFPFTLKAEGNMSWRGSCSALGMH